MLHTKSNQGAMQGASILTLIIREAHRAEEIPELWPATVENSHPPLFIVSGLCGYWGPT